ncbi:phosphoadenylyl-sulfate reductase [Wenzhouxiangella sp. AB-CW3]|uniref:phosphoadenylyl-sulfate reductase n=1 Tax=Wenzhouxiangella sp. AB-CW3 TaxID=2771012 RepID=UPI00168B3B7B|nr:phosphoadenylyl-sulfate reductase [Wenzhouxiangella sp. AB-CW3]QOC22653.1 phosphoadenylyl-sulfate reductase [Wenzhouxiangella sp. AB-CW3]
MKSTAQSIATISIDLADAEHRLAGLEARDRIAWSFEHLPGSHVLSSSFGIQAALMLHMVSEVAPGTPVVFIDTGYHFPETYRFVDELCQRLPVNLKVYRPRLSAAWQEARHGRRWEQGRDALAAYNRDNKVEPMRRALNDLRVGSWFSGLRRVQSVSRNDLPLIDQQWGRCKVHPVADWTDRQVHDYLRRHDLPYHPLRERGYVSIGDWHTTRSLDQVESREEARFFGLMRECGLHELPEGQASNR